MKSHILAPLGFLSILTNFGGGGHQILQIFSIMQNGHASSSCIVPKKNFVCQHKMIVPVYSNEQSCISSFPSILAFLHYRKFLINNKMHDAVTVHAWFQKFSCLCIQNLYKKGTSYITFSVGIFKPALEYFK